MGVKAIFAIGFLLLTFLHQAQKYGRTSAQIMLRWSLQHGYVVIPQSARPEHIEENASVFDFVLAPADMAALDKLHDGFRATGLNPSEVP